MHEIDLVLFHAIPQILRAQVTSLHNRASTPEVAQYPTRTTANFQNPTTRPPTRKMLIKEFADTLALAFLQPEEALAGTRISDVQSSIFQFIEVLIRRIGHPWICLDQAAVTTGRY